MSDFSIYNMRENKQFAWSAGFQMKNRRVIALLFHDQKHGQAIGTLAALIAANLRNWIFRNSCQDLTLTFPAKSIVRNCSKARKAGCKASSRWDNENVQAQKPLEGRQRKMALKFLHSSIHSQSDIRQFHIKIWRIEENRNLGPCKRAGTAENFKELMLNASLSLENAQETVELFLPKEEHLSA